MPLISVNMVALLHKDKNVSGKKFGRILLDIQAGIDMMKKTATATLSF